jgi:hypothetical protein
MIKAFMTVSSSKSIASVVKLGNPHSHASVVPLVDKKCCIGRRAFIYIGVAPTDDGRSSDLTLAILVKVNVT